MSDRHRNGVLARPDFDGFGRHWGVFSAALISYPHLYPQYGVAGTKFAGEWGNLPMRGRDELGKAGEGDERRIKLRFQSLGAVKRDSCMRIHTRRYFSKCDAL